MGSYVTGRSGVVGITRAIRIGTIEGVIAGHDAEGTVRRDSMIIMERNERQAVGERRKTSRVQKLCQHAVGQFFQSTRQRPPAGLWLPSLGFFGLGWRSVNRLCNITKPLSLQMLCHPNYSTSRKNTAAAPMPVPMHIEVTRTFRPQDQNCS